MTGGRTATTRQIRSGLKTARGRKTGLDRPRRAGGRGIGPRTAAADAGSSPAGSAPSNRDRVSSGSDSAATSTMPSFRATNVPGPGHLARRFMAANRQRRARGLPMLNFDEFDGENRTRLARGLPALTVGDYMTRSSPPGSRGTQPPRIEKKPQPRAKSKRGGGNRRSPKSRYDKYFREPDEGDWIVDDDDEADAVEAMKQLYATLPMYASEDPRVRAPPQGRYWDLLQRELGSNSEGSGPSGHRPKAARRNRGPRR